MDEDVGTFYAEKHLDVRLYVGVHYLFVGRGYYPTTNSVGPPPLARGGQESANIISSRTKKQSKRCGYIGLPQAGEGGTRMRDG